MDLGRFLPKSLYTTLSCRLLWKQSMTSRLEIFVARVSKKQLVLGLDHSRFACIGLGRGEYQATVGSLESCRT
jgi:hypothetical protein